MRTPPLILTMAAALAVPTLVTPPTVSGQPSASADTVRIQSEILGRERAAFISLPASYTRTTRAYPILLILDGEAYFSHGVTIATTLARLGHAPEMIVVAVPNATSDFRDRVRDMTPPGLSVSGSSRSEGGDDFLDFLEQELLPAVRERYRAGAPTVLAGHSSGGVIATWAAATRPAAFPVVLSIDAPIHLDDHWLAKRLVEGVRRGEVDGARYASIETRFGWSDARWEELESAAPSTWLLRRVRLDLETHETMVFLALYEGLKQLFGDYSMAGAPIPPRGTAFGVFDHYRRIEEEFRAELPPPEAVLAGLVEDLLTEGRVESAREALRWRIEGYGDAGDRQELEAMIERVAALPPLQVTVEGLKATPMPTPEEAQPYMGTWVGEEWLDANARTALILRIRGEGGTTSAEAAHRFPDGTELSIPIEYLKVVPDGLEFGFMNGMRPMGMIVFSGRRVADVLEGESGFRGIVLPLPSGHSPPVHHFRLVKQPEAGTAEEGR